ncbi:hypothetical protein E8E12_005698 [Didymella heteroderae]|uniref:Xylanolytic transcriptional activator regulatory domain-containing protein n=1 Tax=Didymella heteroderae TaxID=1769908 RepID=A0A9P5C2X3_9PLEO|nr:hypothetical protein E8E12_005698 [Didymella heteroderae]
MGRQDVASLMCVDYSDIPEEAQAALMTSVEGCNAFGESQAEPTQLDQNSVQISLDDTISFDPYFDYSTFARPWNYHLEHTVDSLDWFSTQFFAALRETELVYSPSFQAWSGDMDVVGSLDTDDITQSRKDGIQQALHGSHPGPSRLQTGEPLSGRDSRISSPPNESSHEDRLPFAWNPKSKRIARAKPIKLPPDDPIFANLDPSVEISQASLLGIVAFLRPLRPTSDADTFTLPELPLANVFISLFFNKFAVQAPILHRPTLDVEVLPSALLAIMMAIGSCYSRLRHTRRFGIIALDRTRQNLLALIEDDNSLMREPMIIYATALICYMGLWCGNKRAFELGEALRAVVVTYIRRLPTSREISERQGPSISLSSQSQWLHWATLESEKRLRWFVYMIDAQFPTILGMSGMLTLADIRRWECPCDEEFWAIPTAKTWKSRLGSASEPSCPVFGLLTASILSAPGAPPGNDLLPGVNMWSANLLLTTVMVEIFYHQEKLAVLRVHQEDSPSLSDTPIQDGHAAHLLDMLDIWHRSYNEHQIGRSTAFSANLLRCSTINYYLARLYLVFPVSEIQDCLGKSGPADSAAAMTRLKVWIAQHPDQVATALEDALKCISIALANNGESDPYDLIGLFLCHIIIWAFAHALPLFEKNNMVRQLQGNEAILQSVLEVFEAGFLQNDRTDNAVKAPQLIFRHAIQSLVRLGTWGASSNLALLLHLHPGTPG